jgi:hypothetical protein
MTVITPPTGYLNSPYLLGAYLIDIPTALFGIQFSSLITEDSNFAIQYENKITKETILGIQFNIFNTQSSELGFQFFSQINENKYLPLQYQNKISTDDIVGSQFSAKITELEDVGIQFDSFIKRAEEFGLQYEGKIQQQDFIAVQFTGNLSKDKISGVQFNSFIKQASELGFQTKYVITKDEKLGYQYKSVIITDKEIGIQSEAKIRTAISCAIQLASKIDRKLNVGLQALSKITRDSTLGIQFRSVKETKIGIQFRSVLYNTTNLRVLSDFASRGLTGTNWIASSTAPSSSNSFSVNNLNTDIVEQYWRTESSITNATITCDTELSQGVYVDTLAILGHNLTTSAFIIIEGSNTSNFSSIGFSTTVRSKINNIYYISPVLPQDAFRYWRIIISDNTNPDGFIRIGTVVFGSAIIFSDESFVDQVRFTRTQYVDKIYTEGFSNVSNDRGRKSSIELEFKNLRYDRSNWLSLSNIFDYAGINLKCLWIPIPKQAERFALFGKLAELPQEQHNYKTAESDFVDVSIKIDEAL